VLASLLNIEYCMQNSISNPDRRVNKNNIAALTPAKASSPRNTNIARAPMEPTLENERSAGELGPGLPPGELQAARKRKG
jgi:hypothetical protein